MNPRSNPAFETKEVFLERLKEVMEYRISPRELEAMRFHVRDLHGDIAIRIEREMFGERLQHNVDVHLETRYPATWWHHFKQENFPAWLLRRFPVRYEVVKETKTVEFDRRFVFPKAYREHQPVLGDYIIRDMHQIRR